MANYLAGDVVTFVDNLWATGYSVEHAWQVGRQIASRLQHLCIQDAPQKRRPPSRMPRAWAGAVLKIGSMKIWKTMTQAKWDNGKQHLKLYVDRLAWEGNPMLNYKTLRSNAGFLVHQAMTYSCLMPFLKGFFLTMNAWQEDWGLDGWKMTPLEWVTYLSHKMESKEGVEATDHIQESLEGTSGNQVLAGNEPPPDTVAPVERFRMDIKAIRQMFDSQTPPLIPIDSQEILVAIYGFGNALGKGFDSGIKLESGLSYQIGVWSKAESKESSNWHEFANCIEALEAEASQGNLKGKEIFFFTDNTTVESCCYKGLSSSKRFLDLIIRLRS
ncbi:hypothetical protein ACA910_009967 [Epithemia clementina (nom. ined.)]